MQYGNFEYLYNEQNGFQIIPNNERERPQTFFKYFALNKNSVDALTNMYLYATHPNQFNDPYDCNKNLITFDTEESMKILWEVQYGDVCRTYTNEDDALTFSRDAYMTLLYRKLGLVSLTTTHNNMLMWTHYTNHRGFCIELDTNSLPFRHYGPFPINYMEDINKSVAIERGAYLAMLLQTNVKKSDWKYEDEWRLYIPNPVGFDMKSFGKESERYNRVDDHDRKFKYPICALKSVYLGINFFDSIPNMVISPYEIDIYCETKSFPLESDVLNFLSKISEQNMYNVRILIAKNGKFSGFDFIPISIIKYKEYQYRLIEINN